MLKLETCVHPGWPRTAQQRKARPSGNCSRHPVPPSPPKMPALRRARRSSLLQKHSRCVPPWEEILKRIYSILSLLAPSMPVSSICLILHCVAILNLSKSTTASWCLGDTKIPGSVVQWYPMNALIQQRLFSKITHNPALERPKIHYA